MRLLCQWVLTWDSSAFFRYIIAWTCFKYDRNCWHFQFRLSFGISKKITLTNRLNCWSRNHVSMLLLHFYQHLGYWICGFKFLTNYKTFWQYISIFKQILEIKEDIFVCYVVVLFRQLTISFQKRTAVVTMALLRAKKRINEVKIWTSKAAKPNIKIQIQMLENYCNFINHLYTRALLHSIRQEFSFL